jgi:hypothetical protein
MREGRGEVIGIERGRGGTLESFRGRGNERKHS